MAGITTENTFLIWVYDLEEKKYHHLSSTCKEIYGRDRDAFQKNPDLWKEIIHPEDRARVEKELSSVLRSGHRGHLQYRIVLPDGRVVSLFHIFLPYPEADGRVKSLECIVRVVTGHSEIADFQLADTDIFRQLAELSNEAIIIHIEKRIVYVNRAALNMFGAEKAEDMFNKNVMDFIHPDYKEVVEKRIAKALKNGEPLSLEEQKIIRSDGQEHEILVTSAPLYYMGQNAVIALAHDISLYKKSEKARKDSEQLLRQVIDLIPFMLFAKDKDGRFVFGNKAVAEAHGTTTNQLEGKTYPELVGAEPEFEQYLRDDREVIESGHTKYIPEETFTGADGEIRLLQTTKMPVKLTGFDTNCVLGVAIDITEQKKAEAQLRESEWQYRMTINAMADAIHVVDEDLKIVMCNDSFREWLNELDIDSDIDGKKISEAFPFLGPKIFEEYNKVFKSGKMLNTEETNIVEGTDIITDTRKIPIIEGGKVKQVMTVIRNITAKKRADETLKKREATLNSIFRAAPIGIGLVSERVIQTVNDRLCEMVGYTGEELVGQKADILYESEEEFERVGNVKYSLIEKEGTGTVETRWKLKDGRVIDVLLSSTPLDLKNHTQGVTFTALDITDRKQAVEALRRAMKKLEEDQQALTEKNVALREVLNQIEDEKKQIQSQIQSNVEKILLPMIISMENHLARDDVNYLEALKKSLMDITSPFINKLDSLYSKLTPREVEICNMIKNGMTSKEIARSLTISVETVHKTRYNIRRKLGILHEEINLSTFLKTL
ncbi:MAG: PAS domain S-box protein [candidate division Zixibacteria bacterium]|nr:PAS domain S-box protein [candidate division Zixibacteria bacterium]